MTTEEDVYEALKYRIEVDQHGTRRYFNAAGQLHREEGPAVVRTGESHWFLNGMRHRENGPAIECISGHTEWWHKWQRHRDGGPAIEWSDGGREWWQNGKLHREDGPAVVFPDGDCRWYIHGIRKTETEVRFLAQTTSS